MELHGLRPRVPERSGSDALEILSNESVVASDAFVQKVDAYPTILIARKRRKGANGPGPARDQTGKSIEELGFIVRVGPALGPARAFVLESDEEDVESELLHPWVDSPEISDGRVEWRGRRVIKMFTDDGELVELGGYPKLERRLIRHHDALKKRRIVRNGAPWYRPIERVRGTDWAAPKLLIPELAKVPRVAIDRSGMIPSHGVYAVLPQDNADLEDLHDRLSGGQLAAALEGIAPKVRNGYVRCYRYFLRSIRV